MLSTDGELRTSRFVCSMVGMRIVAEISLGFGPLWFMFTGDIAVGRN